MLGSKLYIVAITQYHHRILRLHHSIESERSEFHRNEHALSGAQRVGCEHTLRGLSIVKDVIVMIRQRSEHVGELLFAIGRCRQRGSRRRDEIDHCPPRRKKPPRPARPNRPTHHAALAASPANSFEGGGARMVRQILRDLGGESW